MVYWPVGVRWLVFVLIPSMLLCAAGVGLAWVASVTEEAGRGGLSPADAVFRYVDSLGYGDTDPPLPMLDDDADELVGQWRAYRAEMDRGGTRPDKFASGVESISEPVDGRVAVAVWVAPTWWAKNGRFSSYRGAAQTWRFETRDDDGWRVTRVAPYPWCGGHVRAEACSG